MLFYFGVSGIEGKQSLRTKSHPLEELGGQPAGQEERCRALLLETPPAKSATESASV